MLQISLTIQKLRNYLHLSFIQTESLNEGSYESGKTRERDIFKKESGKPVKVRQLSNIFWYSEKTRELILINPHSHLSLLMFEKNYQS